MSWIKFSFINFTARTVFWNLLEKVLANSLYWFATHHQSSLFRKEKLRLFYLKFSAEFNEISLNF